MIIVIMIIIIFIYIYNYIYIHRLFFQKKHITVQVSEICKNFPDTINKVVIRSCPDGEITG
jgi:hypothetical protein